MTREEAVKFAEHAVNITGIPEVKEFYRMAAAALTLPTREQVEKMRGEWIHTYSTNNFWTEVWKCSHCWFEDGNGDCFDFCPACGAPMTDEAVDIRLKELEALKDG